MGGLSLAKAKLEYALALADGCTNQSARKIGWRRFLRASVDPDCSAIWASAKEKEANRIGHSKDRTHLGICA